MSVARVVHGSSRVDFGPNPDSTRQRRVRGRGTQNRLPEKSVEWVSSEGERQSDQLVAEVKKNHRNLKNRSSESEKYCRNLENHAGIWKILPRSGKSCRNLKNLSGIFIFSRWNLKFFTKNCWNWSDLAKSH